MSNVTVTPELSLQLQSAVNEAGLTASEVRYLLKPEVLDTILPLLCQKAEVKQRENFSVWQEVTIGTDLVHGRDVVRALKDLGVRENFFAFDGLQSVLHVGSGRQETYELFYLTPIDLGVNDSLSYRKVLRRAATFGIHDGTATALLLVELVRQGIVKQQAKEFRYKVPTVPYPGTFGTDVGFSFANGFTPENPSDTSLSLGDVVCYASPIDDEKLISPGARIIFSRKKDGSPNKGQEVELLPGYDPVF